MLETEEVKCHLHMDRVNSFQILKVGMIMCEEAETL